MAGKLKFKGDPKPSKSSKKRKHRDDEDEGVDGDGETGGRNKTSSGEKKRWEEFDWLPSPSPSHLLGPIFLTLPTPSLPSDPTTTTASLPPSPSSLSTGICLALQPTLGTIIASPLTSGTSSSESTSSKLQPHLSPTTTSQVLVLTRVLDSSSKVTLRTTALSSSAAAAGGGGGGSAQGRFLGCDKWGTVKAESEARGMEEEWEVVAVDPPSWVDEILGNDSDKNNIKDEDEIEEDEDGKKKKKKKNRKAARTTDSPYHLTKGWIGFKSALYDKFLSVDEVAGGKLEFRADVSPPPPETISTSNPNPTPMGPTSSLTTPATSTTNNPNTILTGLSDQEKFRIFQQGEWVQKREDQLREEEANSGRLKGKVEGGEARRDDGLVVVGKGGVEGREEEFIRKFQTRGSGRFIGSNENAQDLKRARQDGTFNEALLDRRRKLKSDRYC